MLTRHRQVRQQRDVVAGLDAAQVGGQEAGKRAVLVRRLANLLRVALVGEQREPLALVVRLQVGHHPVRS